ncbi:MAG TPA: glycosyltransferase family 39 protein, partial [Longimicrobium sp.]
MALALAAVHLVLAATAFDPTPHLGGDNAAYLALARSLLERGTYQELWDPALRPHTQYPPGWPLILALGRLAGIRSWLGMKGIVMAFSALAVALSYLWARRAASPGAALAAGVLLAVGPGVVEHAHWELSDVPFWAFTMLALWAFARAAGRETPGPASEVRPGRRRIPGPPAIAAAATLAAYATRSAGLPLLLAAAGWLAWKRRWRDLGLLAAVVVPFAVGWWARGWTLGTAGYADFLWYMDPYRPALGTVGIAGLLARVVENVGTYTTDRLPILLIGSAGTKFAAALGVAVVALAAAGWALRMRRPGVAELYL